MDDTLSGSAHFGRGNPSTPNQIPAYRNHNFRLNLSQLENIEVLPRIPIHSISAAQASDLMGSKNLNHTVKMSTRLYTRDTNVRVPVCYFFGNFNQDKHIMFGARRDAFKGYGLNYTIIISNYYIMLWVNLYFLFLTADEVKQRMLFMEARFKWSWWKVY